MRETERQKRWAAGSITAYLCLVLILMLSLISGTIASVRNAHARVMTACAMEQGLYSLFAGYDRTLLGQYELFFYNGGDKSGVWKPETMSRKVAETAGEVLSPTASGMGILSGSLSGGQGWDMDAIAACVVGGVSFTGGIGKISGVVTGVLIFTSLTYALTILGIDTNLQFIFEGIIILAAVTLDCLKYVQKK